jgi:hypothetical protein
LEKHNEGSGIGKTHVSQLPRHPAQGIGAGDLQERPSQAASGLKCAHGVGDFYGKTVY